MIDRQCVPSEKNKEDMMRSLEESGYVCGDDISEYGGFYARKSLICMDPIESVYYNPVNVKNDKDKNSRR